MKQQSLQMRILENNMELICWKQSCFTVYVAGGKYGYLIKNIR